MGQDIEGILLSFLSYQADVSDKHIRKGQSPVIKLKSQTAKTKVLQAFHGFQRKLEPTQ